MALRNRSLRSELLSTPRVAKLTDAQYRTFIGLIMLADDEGNGQAGPTYLNAQLFYERPRAKAVIGRDLGQLEASRLIDLYEVDRAPHFAIIGWRDDAAPTYQVINRRQKHKYQQPSSVRSWSEITERSLQSGPDQRGPDRTGPDPLSVAAPCPAGWEPAATAENAEAADEARARGADIDAALRSFRDHKPDRFSSQSEQDLGGAWRAWLRRERPVAPRARRSYHLVAKLEELADRVAVEVWGERIGEPYFGPEGAHAGDPDPMEEWRRYVVRLPNGLHREASEDEADAALDVEYASWKARAARRGRDVA